MSLRKKTIRGVVWVLGQQWGGQLVNLIMLAVLSRLVGAAEFGLITLAVSIIEFTKAFVDQGFSSAVIQFEDLEDAHLDTAFWVNMMISVVISGVGIVFSDSIAALFKTPELGPIFKIMALQIVAFGFVTTQIAILNREMRFEVLAVRTMVTTVIGGIVGIVMAKMGFGVWALVARSMVSSVSNIVVIWTATNWRPKFAFSIPHLKQMVSFGINLVGSNFVERLRRNIDNFLIGYFFNAEMLGYYAMGFKLVDAITKLMIRVLRSISFPMFSRLQKNRQRLAKVYMEASQTTSLMFVPVFLAMILLAEPLIVTIFGAKWLPSVPIMQVLSLFGMVTTLVIYNTTLLVSTGHPNWSFRLNLLTFILSVAGILIGIRYDILGVAVGKTVVSVLVSPITILLVLHVLEIKFTAYLKQMQSVFGASVVMLIVMVLVLWQVPFQNDILKIIVVSLAGGGCYLGYVYVFQKELVARVYGVALEALPDKWRQKLNHGT